MPKSPPSAGPRNPGSAARRGRPRRDQIGVDLTAAHLDPGGASPRTGHLIGVPGAQRQRGAFTPDGIIAALVPVTTILWIFALAATLPRSWQARAGTIPLATTRARRLARRAFRRAQTGTGLQRF